MVVFLGDDPLDLLEFPVELLGEEVVWTQAVFGDVVTLLGYLLRPVVITELENAHHAIKVSNEENSNT